MNVSVLTEAEECTVLSAGYSTQKSSLLFLSPASHLPHLRTHIFRWPQLPGTTMGVAANIPIYQGDPRKRLWELSEHNSWILGNDAGCSPEWLSLPVFPPAVLKGFWVPPTFDAIQLSNFCQSRRTVMFDLGLNVYVYHF